MTVPLRIQRRRTKGWRLPANTKCVTRPGPCGNPFAPGVEGPMGRKPIDKEGAFGFFRDMMRDAELRFAACYPSDEWLRSKLGGHNLACYCPLCPAHRDGKPLDVECPDCSPCHVDVLGQVLYRRNGQ